MVTAKLVNNLYELQNVNPSHNGEMTFQRARGDSRKVAKEISPYAAFKHQKKYSDYSADEYFKYPRVTLTTLVQVMHNSMFKWGYGQSKDAHALYKSIRWSKPFSDDNQVYNRGWTLVPIEVRTMSKGTRRNPFLNILVVRVKPNEDGTDHSSHAFSLDVSIEDWHWMWSQYTTQPTPDEILKGMMDAGIASDLQINKLLQSMDAAVSEIINKNNRCA